MNLIDRDKLIEELKKYKEYEHNQCQEMAEMGLSDFVDKYNHGEFCYLKSIMLVENQSQVNQWIPCSARFPEEYELVLIQNRYGVMSIASRIRDRWFNFQGTELWEAIAWQPLPPKYEG